MQSTRRSKTFAAGLICAAMMILSADPDACRAKRELDRLFATRPRR